jgi:uncharacterized membrane protein
MRKVEQWMGFGFGLIVVLVAGLVIMGPHLQRPSPSPPQELAPGQTETMSGQVVEVLEEGVLDSAFGGAQPYQRLQVRIHSGSLAGREIVLEEGTLNVTSQDRLYRPGDRVYVERAIGVQGDRLYITDYVRTGSLLGIAALFVGLILLVGRGKGLRAILGTLFSIVVVLFFVIPQIKAGRDPVAVSIAGAVVLLTVSTYLVYGWKPKAHAALAGMSLSLLLTAILAWFFVDWSHLNGFGTEEGAFLLMALGPGVRLRGLVLGGIIIGSLGVLDDICVGQASAVFELANANRNLGWQELFKRSLNIGRDHIAAMVNTLVLAYVGASMPLVMMFSIYQEPILRRLSREPIAEEVVRTLVGSVGLVLAVPITSLIAGWMAHRLVRHHATRDEAMPVEL